MKIILSLLTITVLCLGKVSAQIEPTIKKVTLSEQEKVSINQYISEYTTFTMEKKILLDSLFKNGRSRFQLYIDEQRTWTLDLQINDMRAHDYKQTYVSEKGKIEYNQFVLNTYKGMTSNNQIVRFTIDEDNFFGVIFDEHDHYIIRSLKDFTKKRSDESLIIYKSSNIIKDDKNVDYINDALVVHEDNNVEEMMLRSNTPCTYYLKIATDVDYNYYQAKGSNLANTYNDIYSVLNIVEGVYNSTFNMRFILTQQNVWTTTSNGYPYNSTNASSLLSEFKNYWNTYMTNVDRSIAHLFTGKALDGSTVGVAYKGYLNSNNNSNDAYALSMLRPEMYQTTAHEIGHNLNATDNPSACMCGTYAASVMCQGEKAANLWFCDRSISQISPFLSRNSALLTASSSLALTGSVSGFREYIATQKITSNQVINIGHIIYKTAELELGNNFEVKSGAIFEIDFINNCQ